MHIGTAIFVIGILFLLVYSKGFRLLALGGILLCLCLLVGFAASHSKQPPKYTGDDFFGPTQWERQQQIEQDWQRRQQQELERRNHHTVFKADRLPPSYAPPPPPPGSRTEPWRPGAPYRWL